MREIPQREWREFLESFSRRHQSWLASVDGRPHRALQSLELEEGAVIIRLRGTQALRIERPQALRVEESGRGEELGLDFDGARGVSRLRFRAAALPEELDGIAPAELTKQRSS
jgi:hypothetical protein